MKKFLAAFAVILAFTSPVAAQQKPDNSSNKKPVACFPATDVLKFVQEKQKQQVSFVVSHDYSDETLVAMFVNLETTTYTIIEFNHETACVLASGSGLKLQPLKQPGIPI